MSLESLESFENIKNICSDVRSTQRQIDEFAEDLGKEITAAAYVISKKINDEFVKSQIQESKLRLETSVTIKHLNDGSKNCWINKVFSDSDILNNFDAPLEVSKEISQSLLENQLTLLYGNPYYGKSIVLKRTMFDEIKKGYVVLYAESPEKLSMDALGDVIFQVQQKFEKVMVIIDNVHKSGGEQIFKLLSNYSINSTRFLLAAREKALEIRKDSRYTDVEFIEKKIEDFNIIQMSFTENDAKNMMQKSYEVLRESKIPDIVNLSQEQLDIRANQLYKFSARDPFVFHLFMFEDEINDVPTHIKIYFERQKNEIVGNDNNDDDSSEDLLCCLLLGSFGITISERFSDCSLDLPHLKYLEKKYVLLSDNQIFHIRHERWAIEFLSYLFDSEYKKIDVFEKKYKIPKLFEKIISNLTSDEILDIFTIAITYHTINRYQFLIQLTLKYISEFLESSEIDHKEDIFCFGFGSFYYVIKEYENAIIWFDKALSVKPDEYDALINKGGTLSNLGKYAEAIVEYDKALSVKPGYYLALYDKGTALYHLGKYAEAIVEYDKALSVKPDHYHSLYNKGSILFYLGKYAEAIVEYDKALSVKPDHYHSLYNKGLGLYRLGKYAEAIVEYDKALSVKPGYYLAWSDKGNALLSLGKYAEAIVEYDKALSVKPDEYESLNNKGNALLSLGKYAEAIVEYDKALSVKPDEYATLYNKGNALLSLGKYAEAIVEYDKALSVKPGYDPALTNKKWAQENLDEKS